MKQSKIADALSWDEAMRCGVLFCDLCGAQIHQGYLTDSAGRKICSKCEMKEEREKETKKTGGLEANRNAYLRCCKNALHHPENYLMDDIRILALNADKLGEKNLAQKLREMSEK